MAIDVLDLTILQKKGLIKKEESKEEFKGDVLDLTPNVPVEKVTENASPAFDFLENFAQASAQPQLQDSKSSDLGLKIDGVTNKLDDLMYKIETLSGRIAALEAKLR